MICKKDYCGEVEKIGYCQLRNSICHIKCDWNKDIDEKDIKQIQALINWKKRLRKKVLDI